MYGIGVNKEPDYGLHIVRLTRSKNYTEVAFPSKSAPHWVPRADVTVLTVALVPSCAPEKAVVLLFANSAHIRQSRNSRERHFTWGSLRLGHTYMEFHYFA